MPDSHGVCTGVPAHMLLLARQAWLNSAPVCFFWDSDAPGMQGLETNHAASSSLCSPPSSLPSSLGSRVQDTKHSAALQDWDACSPSCSFPTLCPAKTCLHPLAYGFQQSCLGSPVNQRKKTDPSCRRLYSDSQCRCIQVSLGTGF